jgi:hypothetical protein
MNLPTLEVGDVCLEGFTPTTYDFVSTIVEDRYGHPKMSHARPTVIPFESAATLYFVLRATPDGEFPSGKWGTIQHLENLIQAQCAAT